MMTVILFFPHNPYLCTTGAHKRCVEMLAHFKESGARVVLLSSTMWSETLWTSNDIDSLNATLTDDVVIFKPSYLQQLYRKIDKKLRPHPPLGDAMWVPFGMKQWFSEQVIKFSADVICMSYAFWDVLIEDEIRKKLVTIVDTHEIASLQIPIEKKLWKDIKSLPMNVANVPDEFVDEKYFELNKFEPNDEEFSIYDSYTHTIAISQNERDIIASKCPNTNSVYLAASHDVVDNCQQSYGGLPIFPIGPNPLNLQGYAYFIKKVLPIVLNQIPDFMLRVTGSWSKSHIVPTVGVELCGFLQSIDDVYKEAPFLVCPILGGTGQQVKIVEAMARGVPVIAFHAVAKNSPIISNVNGLIANTSEEFASYVVDLFCNRELCQSLGIAAQETIRHSCSRKAYRHVISSLLIS